MADEYVITLVGEWKITNTWGEAPSYHFNARFTNEGTIVDIEPPPPGAKFFGTWSITRAPSGGPHFEVALAIADFGKTPSITAYSGALTLFDFMKGDMTGAKVGKDGTQGTWSAVRIPIAPPGPHQLPD